MALPLINAPSTRQEFFDYVLRRLGRPVINVEVSDEQVQDRINDALLYWWDYHFEGNQKAYYKYQVTQTDVTNGYITLPDNIIGAVQIFSAGGAYSATNIFSFRYQFSLNDLYPLTTGSVLTYQMTMTWLSFLEQLLVGQTPIRYNRYDNRVVIDDWTNYPPGTFMVVEAYNVVDPTVHTAAWHDRMLADLATAYVKRQWGQNLMKFVGIQTVGGVDFDGKAIFESAREEIEKIQEQMLSTMLPALDQIGPS